MKFTAGILSILIICVFAIPNNSFEKITSKNTIENVESSCCEAHNDKSENNKPENNRPDCCNNCNPFVKCCSLMGFIIESPILIDSYSINIEGEKFDFYKSPISYYKGEIWQPPKV